MVYYFNRLPSSLSGGTAWLARMAEIDFVNSSESVVNSGVGAMAFTLVVAGAAGVFQVLG